MSEAAGVVVASAARPGTWVALVQYGDYDGTRGMPLNLPYLPDLDAVAAHRNTERRTLRVDGLHVELLTRPRPGGQVQAILDLSSTDRYRSRLLVAVVAVGLVTGFISAAAGRLALSRRTGSPASTPTVS